MVTEVSPSEGKVLEEWDRRESFDAKALYVSYQVDKTSRCVYCPIERIVLRVVACSQAAVGGWAGLD